MSDILPCQALTGCYSNSLSLPEQSAPRHVPGMTPHLNVHVPQQTTEQAFTGMLLIISFFSMCGLELRRAWYLMQDHTAS